LTARAEACGLDTKAQATAVRAVCGQAGGKMKIPKAAVKLIHDEMERITKERR
jgi:hypothetical protein